jgi:hypothetical protein
LPPVRVLRPISKNISQKRSGGVVKVKALSSSPSTAKIKIIWLDWLRFDAF